MACMLEFPILDDLDRRIVMALQVNGRASWKQIAKALGSTESTVTRRGQQLLSSRTVAVTGVLDHLRCGLGISVYMRFRARPGRAIQVAEAIAALSMPRFVSVVMGSFDVVAEVVVPSHRDVLVMLDHLERIEDVVESQSAVVIRKFMAFEEWRPPALDDEVTDFLRTGGCVTDYPHRDWVESEQLTPQEFAIANMLALDGRITYAGIASRIGISESTAARRVESLVKRGCLRFRAVFESPVIGLDLEFMLWLKVEPSQVAAVGQALAKHPASRYVSAATGSVNIIVQGVLPSYGDLYQYTTRDIGEVPGIISADLTLQVRSFKRAWVPIGENGRPSPPQK